MKKGQKKKTLRTKLIWSTVAMSIIPMMILVAIVYANNAAKGLDRFRGQIHSEIAKVDDGLSSYFNAILAQVGILAQTDDLKEIDARITEYITPEPDNSDGTITMKPEQNDPFERKLYHTFKRIKDANPQFFSISLGVEENGGFLMYPEKPRKKGYDAREREWYMIGKQSKTDRSASDLYVSMDGSSSVELMNKIYDPQGEFAGVLNFSLDLQEFQEKIGEVQIGDSGFLFVIDRSGNVISHKNRDYIGKNLSEMGIPQYQDASAISEEEVEFTDPNSRQTYVMQAFASKDSLLGWTYIVTLDKDEFDAIRSQSALLKTLLWIFLAVLIAAIAFSRIYADRLARPIVQLADRAKKISDFDLTAVPGDIALKHQDEIGVLAESMETMSENLRAIVGNISAYAEDTALTADRLKTTAHITTDSVRRLSDAISNLAGGVTSQAEDVESAANNIENSTNLLNRMEIVLGELVSAVEDIKLKKDEGKDILSKLSDINTKSRQQALFVNDMILSTDASVEKIAKASDMIQSLSDQTNLLALNASIEAARAGEAGRGFAVVAEEIRKLAEASAGFTDEIGKVIHELKDNSRNAVSTMSEVGKTIDVQNEKMDETRDKFNEIEKAVESGRSIVEEVESSSREVREHNTAVIEIIQNLMAMAEENAVTTQETAENIETQALSMNKISDASDGLAEIAEKLRNESVAFKL